MQCSAHSQVPRAPLQKYPRASRAPWSDEPWVWVIAESFLSFGLSSARLSYPLGPPFWFGELGTSIPRSSDFGLLLWRVELRIFAPCETNGSPVVCCCKRKTLQGHGFRYALLLIVCTSYPISMYVCPRIQAYLSLVANGGGVAYAGKL